MDGTPEGVRQVLAPLREMIEKLKEGIKVEAVVVFGSRARDEHLVDSDVDVLVVSDDFEGLPRWERGYRILCAWSGSLPLEPIGMTTRELRRCMSPLCAEFERLRNLGLLERRDKGWEFSPGIWKLSKENPNPEQREVQNR